MSEQFVVYNMDVMKALAQLPSSSVDCVVTSPPYWGLRDYKVVGQIGLEEHPKLWIDKMVAVFEEVKRVLKPTGTVFLNVGDTYFAKREKTGVASGNGLLSKEYSLRCGGTPDGVWLQPKQRMLMPHRLAIALQDSGWILRNDLVWHKLNHMPSSVRDRFSNSFEYIFFFVKQRKYYFDLDAVRVPHSRDWSQENWTNKKEFLPKQRVIQPHGGEKTLAETFNPLGKNPSDYFESDEFWLEELKKGGSQREAREFFLEWKKQNPEGNYRQFYAEMSSKEVSKYATEKWRELDPQYSHFQKYCAYLKMPNPNGKAPSDYFSEDVFETTLEPFSEAHFACFPTALPRHFLKCGCPKQICKKCGKPRERITKPTAEYAKLLGKSWHDHSNDAEAGATQKCDNTGATASYETIGWTECECGKQAGYESGIVLDIFLGSGTTLQVAQEMNLRGIGIELNPKYLPLINLRLLGDKHQTSLNENKIKIITEDSQ